MTQPAHQHPPGVAPPVLEVDNLQVSFSSGEGPVHAVRFASFAVQPGEIVGVVGESGSGKSTLLKGLMGILPPTAGVRSDGVRLGGRDLSALSKEDLRHTRGGEMAMVFQDPVNTFNPSWTIGSQFRRVLRLHRPDLRPKDHDEEILSLLDVVGIDGRGKLDSYPFQFSQGQIQRIMIAVACASRDLKLLLADEPTTSLDVTIEAQVLQLLHRLREERELSLMLVTHDLSIVAQVCDRVLVMYGGRIIEDADVVTLFESPAHPYTQQLLRSIPSFPHDGDRLYTMRGSVPDLRGLDAGCPFAPRCDRHLGAVCDERIPFLRPTGVGSQLAGCHLYPTEAEEAGGGTDVRHA